MNFGIYVQALLAKNTTTTLQKQLKTIKDLQVKVTPTFGKISQSEISKVNKELKNKLNELTGQVKNPDITPKVDTKQMSETSNQISNLGKSFNDYLNPSVAKVDSALSGLDNTTTTFNKSADYLIGIIGKVAVWTVATNAIFGTKRALEELFQTYVKLEAKLIAIERVSSGFDMSYIFNEAYNSAQKYGAKLDDMLDAVEEIARSYGDLTEKEVIAAAEAGVLASTIAEMDGKDAVGTIIAVSNVYDLAIENARALIDMANEVDNNFSVSAAGIADAWERSAATAKTFGVELHNLTGYITAISTVTQESGTVIGNALKTIFSRITTMGAARGVLEDIGIEIKDMAGETRDVQDIIAELAGKWDTLSATQQQNIGVTVAGRYQLTRFLALMNDWEIAVDASETALKSEGSAISENLKYQESYEAKLNKLTNAQEKLAQTINDGQMQALGKWFIDGRIALTDFASKIFETVDATVIFVSLLGSLIIALGKTQNGTKALSLITGLFRTEQEQMAASIYKTNLAQYKQAAAADKLTISTRLSMYATQQNKIAQENMAVAAKLSEMGFINLGREAYNAAVKARMAATVAKVAMTTLSAIKTLGISLLIGAVVGGITSWIEKQKELNQQLKEQTKLVGENRKVIDDLIKNYEDASKAVDELSKSIGSEEYNDALDKQKDALQALIDKYPAYKKQLEDENKLWREKVELVREYQDVAAKEKYKEYKKYSDNQNPRNKYRFEEDGASGSGDAVLTNYAKTQEMFDKYNRKMLDLLQDYYRAKGYFTDLENEWLNELKVNALENINSLEEVDKLSPMFQSIMADFAKSGEVTEEQFRNYLQEIKDNFGATFNIDDIVSQYVTDTDEINDATGNVIDKFDEWTDNLKTMTETFFDVKEGTAEAIDGFLTLYNALGKAGENTEYLRGLASDLSETLTIGGIKIFENSDALLENIDMLQAISETLRIAKSDEEFYAEALAKGTMYVSKTRTAAWETFRQEKVAELEMKQAEVVADIESKNYLMTAEQQATIDEIKLNNERIKSAQETSKNILQAEKVIVEAKKDNTEKAQAEFDKLLLQAKQYSTQIDYWKNLKIVGTTVSDFKKMSDASSKQIDYLELAEAALLKYKSAMEAVENELKILQERNKQLIEGSREWFNNISAQQSVIEKYKQSIKTYIAQIQVQLKNTKLEAEDRAKLVNQIEDLNLEYEKLNTTLTDLTETQEKYYAGQISDKLELIENLEDKRHKQALENIKSEREAFQKQIDEQLALMKKASQARTYEQELNDLQEKRLDILSQISRLEGDDSRLARSRILDLSKELQDVEEQISDLNYDRNNTLREDALDDLSTQLDDYYDNLEDLENNRNELILSSLDDAKNSLDDLNISLSDLQSELSKWSNNLNNFGNWFKTFDNLVSTMPSANIVSSSVPINSVDSQGNTNTTSIIFNITGATEENAQNIGDTIVDNLKKAGVITTSNNQ